MHKHSKTILSKNQDRTELIVLRNKVLDKDLKSQLICNNLKSLIDNQKNILVYIPIKDEVDVSYLFNSENLYLPFIREQRIGKFETLENLNKVQTNKGIFYEPKKSIEAKIDYAIIPGLAFDKNGYRIGYGGGWYDKFLEKHSEIIKIGVCFEELLYDNIVTLENHDIKMNFIVIEKGIINLFNL